MLKFIGVAILLNVSFAAAAVDVLPHNQPDTYSASGSATAASVKLTSDHGFSPRDGLAEWRAGGATAQAATFQQNRTDWTWAIFGLIGLTVGGGGFMLGRNRSGAATGAAAMPVERRRAMSTVLFDENEPGFANLLPRSTGKAAAMVTTSDGETYGVFLKRAALLVGKGSGPDTGRC